MCSNPEASPALLTSTSIVRKWPGSASIALSVWKRSRTSNPRTSALTPNSFSKRSLRACSGSVRRPVMTRIRNPVRPAPVRWRLLCPRKAPRDKCRFAHVPVRFRSPSGGIGAPSRRCGGNLDGSSAKIGNFALLCILHAEYFKTDGPMGRLNLEYFLAKRIASVSSGRRNNVMVRVATLSVAIGVAVMIVSLARHIRIQARDNRQAVGFRGPCADRQSGRQRVVL